LNWLKFGRKRDEHYPVLKMSPTARRGGRVI
jgi:hypothetical protein